MKKIISISVLLFFIVSIFSGESFAGTPFQFLDNRIIMPVYINNQGPFFVMVDTGATNILSNDVASRLNLNRYGQFPITGGGEHPVMASYCDVDTLSADSQVLSDSRMICMDLKDMQQAIGFPRLDGLIGYEVFQKFLTQINFDKMEIQLSDFSAGARLNKKNSHVIPLRFQGTTPIIDGALDGLQGSFWLDTGDRFSATLSLPFIRTNSLSNKYRLSSAMMTGYGIGGPLSTSVTFAGQLQLGNVDLILSNPLIRLPTMNSGALNDPTMAGTIGMGLLRQFNIVIDYSRSQMILTQNSAFQQDRAFDRSGMWLSQDSGGYVVADVLQGGPAWNAGIRQGQIVLAVNGLATNQINLLTLREQLKDPGNTQVTLLIRDDAGTRSIAIILKDLVPDP